MINVGGLKKRGKRTLEYTVYEKISMNKIAKLNKESERQGANLLEKRKKRNQASAQKSRLLERMKIK